MNAKLGLVCCLLICIGVGEPAHANLQTLEEVIEAISHRLPPAQVRLSPPEISVLRFAIRGEDESLEIPWAEPSYDHGRTTVFLEELVRFYKAPETAQLRPRFARLLYTEKKTFFCNFCTKSLFTSHFHGLRSYGEDGLEIFLELFQIGNTRALPPMINVFLLEAFESVVNQDHFPQSIQELDFMGGVYSKLSPAEQTRVRSGIHEEPLFKRFLYLLDDESAIPCTFAVDTDLFVESLLEKTHYRKFCERQNALMREAMLERLDQVIIGQRQERDLLGQVIEGLSRRGSGAFAPVGRREASSSETGRGAELRAQPQSRLLSPKRDGSVMDLLRVCLPDDK